MFDKKKVLNEMNKNRWIRTDNQGKLFNRRARQLISEQRKIGNIFVPIDDGFYVGIENATQEDVDKFVNKQIKSMQTQYFNTLKPLLNYVNEIKTKGIMEQLQFMFEEG